VRLLHCSDLHVTDGPRLADQQIVFDAIVKSAIAGDVDVSLVCGDLTGTQVPHVATTTERTVMCDFLQRLAMLGPVILPRGNHDDADDVLIYSRLAAKFPIVVAVEPEYVTVPTRAGEVDVFLLPWMTTAHVGAVLGAAGVPLGINVVRSEAMRLFAEFIEQWVAASPRRPGVPRILAGHAAVGGARLAGGEVLLGHDVEVSASLFGRLDMDYIGLGHIHLEQSVAARAFYSGSPSPHSFGEPGEHGWWLVRIGEPQTEGDMTMVRVPSPAPQVVTLNAVWDVNDERWMLDRDPDDFLAGLAGAEVRVRTHVPEALVDSVDADALVQSLTAKGAGRVVIERKVVVAERVRSTAMAAATTVAEQAGATLDMFEPPVDDQQRTRVLALVAEVAAACGFTR